MQTEALYLQKGHSAFVVDTASFELCGHHVSLPLCEKNAGPVLERLCRLVDPGCIQVSKDTNQTKQGVQSMSA